MAIDFPNAPLIGQQHNPGTGTNYVWDGSAWNIVLQVDSAFVSDTPPANPIPGQQWFRASNCQMYIWYNDGNSAQWVQSAGAAVPAQPVLWETLYDAPATSILTWQKVDLLAYSDLQLRVLLRPDATASWCALQVSEDNGATWLAGTSYYWQANYSASGGATTAAATGQSGVGNYDLTQSATISPSTTTPGLKMTVDIANLNKPLPTGIQASGGFQHPSIGMLASNMYGMVSRLVAANGVKLTMSNACTGYITLLGKRG